MGGVPDLHECRIALLLLTAKSYIGALRSTHIQANLSTEGLNDERLPLIIRGARRVYGDGTKRVRYPLTSDILTRMVYEINDDEEGINVKAALCVAFAVFFRSGDFAWDTWSPESHLQQIARHHVAF